MQVKEIWKPVKGYETTYIVSNFGRIKAVERVNYVGKHFKEHIMKYAVDRNGYQRVYLTYMGITKSKLVHRVVAEAFIQNTHGYPEINHKDENKQNNKIENLEWCTHKYNSNYGTRTARIIPKTISKTSKKVIQSDDDGNIIKIWDSLSSASRFLGISEQNISKCCLGKRHHCGGFS